jgi:hypothetical protein
MTNYGQPGGHIPPRETEERKGRHESGKETADSMHGAATAAAVLLGSRAI